MNKVKSYILIILTLSIHSLYAPIKSTLSGSTYSRVENDKSAIRQDRKPWISVYGSQRVEPRTDVISLYFQYVLPLDLLNTSNLNGSSTISQGNAMMTMDAGADFTVTSTLYTQKSINYSPGHEIMAMFTAQFPAATPTGYYDRFIGMFDSNNGFAIGERKGTFGILYLQDGSVPNPNLVPTFIPQSTFNIDKLDGTGKSGMIWDPSTLNIFYIAFGWLGAAPIEFGIATEGGKWVPFHRILYPNLYTSPSAYNPSMPLAISISKESSDATLLKVQTASWDATITGAEHATRMHSYAVPAKEISSTEFIPILSLRNRTTYAHKTSTGRMRLLYANFGGADTNNLMSIQFIKNADLTTGFTQPVWTELDPTMSLAEYDTSSDATIDLTTSGTLILQSSAYSQSSANLFFKENDVEIDLFPGETLTIAGAESGGGTVTMDASVTWEEYL